ncbi:MAG: hypothetical protein M1830_009227 [Pleopsidium flavum]|nr:MAG: hypothetical protein M1830_009227 [Pleopsidium flavum]
MVTTTGTRNKRARASEDDIQGRSLLPSPDGGSSVDRANQVLGETVPPARAMMTLRKARSKGQGATPSGGEQPHQTTTSSVPQNVDSNTLVVSSSGVSGRLKQLLDEDFHFLSPKPRTEARVDSLQGSSPEEELQVTSAELTDRYLDLADKPFEEISQCHLADPRPSLSQRLPIASSRRTRSQAFGLVRSHTSDVTGLANPTPTPSRLLLEAYNPWALNRRGLLHIRGELNCRKHREPATLTEVAQHLPSQELRESALQDVLGRLDRRFRPGDLPRTLRGAIRLKAMGAECWIEWGKEKGIDYSAHQQRFRALEHVSKLLGPEKTSYNSLPSSRGGSGLLSGSRYTDDGLLSSDEIARRIPLHLEQMDLTMILGTDNSDECHWCQGEQCWGIPGGLHFKNEEYQTDKPPKTDGPNPTPPSVMCRDCGTYRYKIGSHALHGSWRPLPPPSSPPTHPKTYMCQTSCAVCTGLATTICGGCPLRACVNCQVSLDVFCQGNMDRLLNSYGERGRRNDARLMGSSLAWATRQRALRAEALAQAAETAEGRREG